MYLTNLLFFEAFPSGEFYKLPNLPDISAVNVLGDFEIAADRLAIIDGEGLWYAPVIFDLETLRD